MTTRLAVHMDPWDYLAGRADMIASLLGEGSFNGLPGKWQVRTRRVSTHVLRRTELRCVEYELEPLDAVARRAGAKQAP
jgi:hypothetical protein